MNDYVYIGIKEYFGIFVYFVMTGKSQQWNSEWKKDVHKDYS